MFKITLINTILVICFCINYSYSQNFEVQLAAYDRAVSNDHFLAWGHSNVVLTKDNYDIYRYNIRGFNTRAEAEALRQTVLEKGFPYAQIIDLKVQEALCIQSCRIHTPKVEELDLEPMFFDSGSAALNDRSKRMLMKIKTILEENPNYTITLEGHTDSQGSAAVNIRLATERARATRSFLVKQGIDAYRLKTKVFGESQPIAKNRNGAGQDIPMGRRYNRRVTPMIKDSNGQVVDKFLKKVGVPSYLIIQTKKQPQRINSGNQ